jgi:hypothetical protein
MAFAIADPLREALGAPWLYGTSSEGLDTCISTFPYPKEQLLSASKIIQAEE